MANYYPPSFKGKSFTCPRCNVYAQQLWYAFNYASTGSYSDCDCAICQHCRNRSTWFEGRMIDPASAPVPSPHPDLPETCKRDYEEAREVFTVSPRSSGALLRLCIQKLLVELGQEGRNINADIASLVAAGLPVEVQRALDVCRVVGNNAVHPGEMSVDDNPEVVASMFELINYVVQDRITRPRELSALYDSLPAGALAAIERRDAGP